MNNSNCVNNTCAIKCHRSCVIHYFPDSPGSLQLVPVTRIEQLVERTGGLKSGSETFVKKTFVTHQDTAGTTESEEVVTRSHTRTLPARPEHCRCNRLRCPLARMSGLQCFNMGHNGHGINLYGVSMILM